MEEKVNIEENKEIFNKFLVAYVVLLILLSFIIYAGVNKRYNAEKIILANLNSTYNSLKTNILSNSTKNDSYKEKAFLIIYKINNIDKNVLKEIYFNSISYNNGVFFLKFVCFNYDQALAFQNSLKESLKDVAIISNIQSNKRIITIDNENQTEIIDNTIEIKVK
ncbi:MAG: hypothetical protein QXY79_03245 [Candidatus Methanomethylicia archaeon]